MSNKKIIFMGTPLIAANYLNSLIDNRSIDTTKGQQVRDFCYIDDIVEALFLLTKKQDMKGDIINIGSGMPIKIIDVIEEVKKYFPKAKINYGAKKYRKNESLSLYPDISKLKKNINWEPKYTLQEGIKRIINYEFAKRKSSSKYNH